MTTPRNKPVPLVKSTVDEIRQRFDNDVERFSNLDTGQTATMDAPLAMSLVTRAAAAILLHCAHMQARPEGTGYKNGEPSAPPALLDIGCGAGNYSLRMLQEVPGLEVTLVDLSRPMLDRAVQRVTRAMIEAAESSKPVPSGRSPAPPRERVRTIQGDIRGIDLGEKRFDIVLAAMVFHHLRETREWEAVFAKVYRSLKPGGSLWIVDHLEHDDARIEAIMRQRWSEYLIGLGGESHRDKVLAYTAKEDTPRSLMFQLDTLRKVGFVGVDVLHKTACFGAFGGVRST